MMTSLLSIFDPCSFNSSSLDLYWLMLLLFILFFCFTNMYVYPCNYSLFFMIFLKKLNANFPSKNQSLIFSCMFLMIFLLNYSGLLPYVFPPTSQFTFNLSISVFMWLICVISDMKFSLKTLLSHLTPSSCPMILTPFMVLVEIVSFFIRPLALGMRLTANILAGHMILNFLCSLQKLEMLSFFLIFFSQSLFMIFEMAVALIQAYVFSKLIHEYWAEHDEHK